MTEVLGWTSSGILLATVATQIFKQYRERTGKGVSLWLFIGQAIASCGFTLYSFLVRNWVFTLTNGLLTIAALVGLALTVRFKRQEARHS